MFHARPCVEVFLQRGTFDTLCFTLWIATVFTTGLGCPELCTCSDKYGRHFAECSYKDIAEVPDGFPSNVTTVSLSANKISLIPLGSFDNNLTALHLLKMNNNEMAHLPRNAFSNLKELRSLRLNSNKFITIAEGTFDGLVSLSHLQIYSNPFACTCSLNWLRAWISLFNTMSVAEQDLIICASPEKLKGEVIGKLPESRCTSPNVTIRTEPNIHNTTLYEANTLILTCDFKGNPKPLVMWNILMCALFLICDRLCTQQPSA
uniref:Ig-like domain-containing protein n=1 Tax=Seriola dumerili TaxID=41447 RepID=A0A3B4UVX2_SERDU